MASDDCNDEIVLEDNSSKDKLQELQDCTEHLCTLYNYHGKECIFLINGEDGTQSIYGTEKGIQFVSSHPEWSNAFRLFLDTTYNAKESDKSSITQKASSETAEVIPSGQKEADLETDHLTDNVPDTGEIDDIIKTVQTGGVFNSTSILDEDFLQPAKPIRDFDTGLHLIGEFQDVSEIERGDDSLMETDNFTLQRRDVCMGEENDLPEMEIKVEEIVEDTIYKEKEDNSISGMGNNSTLPEKDYSTLQSHNVGMAEKGDFQILEIEIEEQNIYEKKGSNPVFAMEDNSSSEENKYSTSQNGEVCESEKGDLHVFNMKQHSNEEKTNISDEMGDNPFSGVNKKDKETIMGGYSISGMDKTDKETVMGDNSFSEMNKKEKETVIGAKTNISVEMGDNSLSQMNKKDKETLMGDNSKSGMNIKDKETVMGDSSFSEMSKKEKETVIGAKSKSKKGAHKRKNKTNISDEMGDNSFCEINKKIKETVMGDNSFSEMNKKAKETMMGDNSFSEMNKKEKETVIGAKSKSKKGAHKRKNKTNISDEMGDNSSSEMNKKETGKGTKSKSKKGAYKRKNKTDISDEMGDNSFSEMNKKETVISTKSKSKKRVYKHDKRKNKTDLIMQESDWLSRLHPDLQEFWKKIKKPKYKCQICSEECISDISFQMHVMKHKDFQYCKGCDVFIAGGKEQLVAHNTENHPDNLIYKCFKCEMRFKNRCTLKLHFIKKHCSQDVNNLECIVCKKRFYFNSAFEKHMSGSHKPKIIVKKPVVREKTVNVEDQSPEFQTFCKNVFKVKRTCEICSKVCKNSKRYQEHVKCTHTDKQICKLCDKILPIGQENMDAHNVEKHLDARNRLGLKCEKCHRYLGSKNALKNHVVIRHCDNQQEFECKKCKIRFNSKWSLKTHNTTHRITCFLCTKHFTYRWKLVIHMKEAHKRYLCKLRWCNDYYSNQAALERHEKCHRDRAIYLKNKRKSSLIADNKTNDLSTIQVEDFVSGVSTKSTAKLKNKRKNSSVADIVIDDVSTNKMEENVEIESTTKLKNKRKSSSVADKEIDDISTNKMEENVEIESTTKLKNKRKNSSVADIVIDDVSTNKMEENVEIESTTKLKNKRKSSSVADKEIDDISTNQMEENVKIESTTKLKNKRKSFSVACNRINDMASNLLEETVTDVSTESIAKLENKRKDSPVDNTCIEIDQISSTKVEENASAFRTESDEDTIPFEEKEKVSSEIERGNGSSADENEESSSEKEKVKTSSQEEKERTKIKMCMFCKRRFKTEFFLKKHERKHIEKWNYTCQECGKVLKSISSFKGHARLHKEKAFQCQICRRRFRRKKFLKTHLLQMHDEEELYRCKDCGKCLKTLSIFMTHRNGHAGEKTHDCSECDQTFSTSASLDMHKTLQHQQPKNCDLCGKIFNYEYQVVNHKRYFHKINELFKCNFDGKQFKTLLNLKWHSILWHKDYAKSQGWLDYECETCGKPCLTKEQLFQHLETHTGFAIEMCTICCKQFRQKSELEKHLKEVHDLTETFDCPLCNRSFQQETTLNKHLSVFDHTVLNKTTDVSSTQEGEILSKSSKSHEHSSETNATTLPNHDSNKIGPTKRKKPAILEREKNPDTNSFKSLMTSLTQDKRAKLQELVQGSKKHIVLPSILQNRDRTNFSSSATENKPHTMISALLPNSKNFEQVELKLIDTNSGLALELKDQAPVLPVQKSQKQSFLLATIKKQAKTDNPTVSQLTIHAILPEDIMSNRIPVTSNPSNLQQSNENKGASFQGLALRLKEQGFKLTDKIPVIPVQTSQKHPMLFTTTKKQMRIDTSSLAPECKEVLCIQPPLEANLVPGEDANPRISMQCLIKLAHKDQNLKIHQTSLLKPAHKDQNLTVQQTSLLKPVHKDQNLKIQQTSLLKPAHKDQNLKIQQTSILKPAHKDQNLTVQQTSLLKPAHKDQNLTVQQTSLLKPTHKDQNLKIQQTSLVEPAHKDQNLKIQQTSLLKPAHKDQNLKIQQVSLLKPADKDQNPTNQQTSLLKPASKDQN